MPKDCVSLHLDSGRSPLFPPPSPSPSWKSAVYTNSGGLSHVSMTIQSLDGLGGKVPSLSPLDPRSQTISPFCTPAPTADLCRATLKPVHYCEATTQTGVGCLLQVNVGSVWCVLTGTQHFLVGFIMRKCIMVNKIEKKNGEKVSLSGNHMGCF